MRRNVSFLSRVVQLTLLGLAGWLTPTASAQASIAVVVRPDGPVDNLTFAELRTLLLGNRQFWSSNLRVTLLARPPGARERAILLKNVSQMSEAQFQQYWIAKVFRAEVTSGPRIVSSPEMTAELALAIPGALGFLDASQVPSGLKVLKINGMLPGAKGYPLQ